MLNFEDSSLFKQRYSSTNDKNKSKDLNVLIISFFKIWIYPLHSLVIHFLFYQKNFFRNLFNHPSSAEFEKTKASLENSSVEVDNETKLKLYGLYKQAIKDVCSTPKPYLIDFVGRANWTAWSSLGKMTQQDAQKQYIQTVQQFISSSTTQSLFFSNRRNFFDSTFLDSNDTKTKNEENKSENNTEQIELIKKRALHWEIVLNRPEKYNAITQPIYERIIEIFDQDAQDKQLILLSMTEKGKFYSSWFCKDGCKDFLFSSFRSKYINCE